MASTSVRVRSASPKSVSFSPTLTRKCGGERELPPVPSAPQHPPLYGDAAYDWKKYFADFSAYLDALLADLQNSIRPGAPNRATSPASPSAGGYGSLNGAHNNVKPNSPTYHNHSTATEKITPTRNYGTTTAPATGGRTGNLSELDTLLDDLSNARYTGYGEGNRSANIADRSANFGDRSNNFGDRSANFSDKGSNFDRSGTLERGSTLDRGGTLERGGTFERSGYNSDRSGNFADRSNSYGERSGTLERSYIDRTDGYGRTNGAGSPGTPRRAPSTPGADSRPSVDSLLDQLSADLANGSGPVSPRSPVATKQVTVTVQETVVEPASPHMHQHNHQHEHVQHQYVQHQHAQHEHVQHQHAQHEHGQRQHELVQQHAHHQQELVHAPQASNATRELDDLMASLSDFKLSQSGGVLHHQQQPDVHQQVYSERRAWQERYHATTAPASDVTNNAPPGNLERMLGSLRADMSRQGVQTPQKGCCNACDKPIVGQVITALGRTWHPEHFTCAHCSQELGTRNFFERDGRPYCEPDYHNLFSPRCAYCNGPILDKCVTALEKTWHTEHFFCAQCGQQFGEDGFHERDGKPYCRNDYFDMFAPKCGGCSRPIMENYISALNSQWHPDCFVCRECRSPFHGGSFFDHEGLPYCETHYHAVRGSLCAGCHKPIAGRCITAMMRKFHPEHFVCAFCLKQLNKGTFKEQNDKPYCHNCFDKLFG